ncbi:COX15/CtaA family protein [Actinomarinicola tropica]|uniref:COX15/CtaA family protein n=1 Tax=Actinomarinicola tropica TaxID=2789776 RepID=UPI0018972FB0|nr:COX15/CtaA family protein [Actinomarinicola tropica]
MARRTSPAERTVSPATFRRITLAVLVTQVVIVLTGAAVRLTGSGLGCSNWPNCTEERLVAPMEYNALIEFVNRLVSFPVLAAVLVALWAARRRTPYRSDLFTLSAVILGGVVAQVLIGAVVVWLHLLPSTVIVHFLISMVLIGTSVALHHRARADLDADGRPGGGRRAWVASRSHGLANLLVVGAGAVLVTGTLVTGSGPHGGDEEAERLGLFLPTITRVHAVTVWIFLAVLVVTLLVLRREGAPRTVLQAGTTILAVGVAQGSIGYLQYWNGVPELLVFLHIIGAMAVWGTAVWFRLEHAASARAGVDAGPVPVPAGGAT